MQPDLPTYLKIWRHIWMLPNTYLITYGLCMSSGDFLIWWSFEVWSMNICYCLLSAPQNQFKTEKKTVWLVNVFCLFTKRFIFSKKGKQIFVLQIFKFRQISKALDDKYRKVLNSSLSRLLAPFQIFRRLMKAKFDVYVLWPLAHRVQNWIVDRSIDRNFAVCNSVKSI